MRRVYGYKRRNFASGKRYQDGVGAQALHDDPTVIETTPAIRFTEPEGEEIEIKAAATAVKEAPIKPVTPAPKVVPKTEAKDETENEEVGDLPKHFTGFMPTDNVQPTIGSTTPEEADPEAE